MGVLVIQCRYIAYSYTGVRHDRDRRDELDWPPAPARLHQAFIASTLANLPDVLREEYAGKTLDALRWLESLPPPSIIATRLEDDSGYRRALMVAMPHNSPAKEDFARYHSDLAPVLHGAPCNGSSLFAEYCWSGETLDFSRSAAQHLPSLAEAASKLRYMGRAEDRVECEVQWRTDGLPEPMKESLETWRPSTQTEDARLLTARPQSTNELMDNFKASENRIARGAKSPARLFFQEQSYIRDAAEGLLPVHVAIFQIYRDTGNPDEMPVVSDAINAHRWRSPLRALACNIAKEAFRWTQPDLANELISGHMAGGCRTQQPHLAFVPLPSLSLSGHADGRVRRYGLLGYAARAKASDAASIYRTLAVGLDGEEVEPGYRLHLLDDLIRNDKVWPIYTCASHVWISVTPLAIDRGYKVPTRAPDGTLLLHNERHLRRLAEWTKLVRASLRHICLPVDLVESCRIQLTPSPLFPKTERAERYRPRGENITLMHSIIEFSRPVRGPFLVGDRRYQGFGLFVPGVRMPIERSG